MRVSNDVLDGKCRAGFQRFGVRFQNGCRLICQEVDNLKKINSINAELFDLL